jgi:MFS family permease
MATLGWMAGCWTVSLLRADNSTVSGYGGAVTWLALVVFTYGRPGVEPPLAGGRPSIRQRLGLDALTLLKHRDTRVVFLTAALFAIPIAAFYPYTPPNLRELGFQRTTAWMSLGQISEIIAMFSLAGLLGRWRLKWIITAGLGLGVLRFALCALAGKGWLLAGISLHGCSFTLVFITAQIYLDERVDRAWRARAQALLSLMMSGVGNLVGYLGCGAWYRACDGPAGERWPLFWTGLTAAVVLVLGYFLLAYRGVGSGLAPKKGGGGSQVRREQDGNGHTALR